MEITKEMKQKAKDYDSDYLEKLKEIMRGLQMMVLQTHFDTNVGVLNMPSALINIQSLINTGLAEDADYYLNKRPDNVLQYLIYDNYRGVTKLSNTGTPIWYQMDGESSVFYNMFEAYRDLLRLNGATRDYATIADMFDIKIVKVGRVSTIHHWDERIKAFDHFGEVTRMRLRIDDAYAMEDRHSSAIVEYIGKVMDRIRQFSDEDLKDLSPKNAVEVLKELQKMERLSRGVDPNNVSKLTSPTTKIKQEETKKDNSSVTINQISTGDGTGFVNQIKSEEEKEKEEKVLMDKTAKAIEITKVLQSIMPSVSEAAEEKIESEEKLQSTIKELKRKKRKKDKDNKTKIDKDAEDSKNK